MIQPKSRRERIEEYGSFLFCPEKNRLCFAMDNDEGICERALCFIEDPAYIKQQERIEQNMKENAAREREVRKREKLDPPAPIRRQTKSKTDLLEQEIELKQNKAKYLYRVNKPRAADNIMHEVTMLRKQLLRVKGS